MAADVEAQIKAREERWLVGGGGLGGGRRAGRGLVGGGGGGWLGPGGRWEGVWGDGGGAWGVWGVVVSGHYHRRAENLPGWLGTISTIQVKSEARHSGRLWGRWMVAYALGTVPLLKEGTSIER